MPPFAPSFRVSVLPRAFALALAAGLGLAASACTLEGAPSPPGSSGSSGGSGVDVPDDATPAESYCLRKCIDADQTRCLDWANAYGDGFIGAYETCGNDEGCLAREMLAQPRTPAAEGLAESFCSRCAEPNGASACRTGFYEGRAGVGWIPLVLTEASLTSFANECLAEYPAGGGSALTQSLCQIDLSKCVTNTLPRNQSVCRAR